VINVAEENATIVIAASPIYKKGASTETSFLYYPIN
jgi:hypothetical protein